MGHILYWVPARDLYALNFPRGKLKVVLMAIIKFSMFLRYVMCEMCFTYFRAIHGATSRAPGRK